MATTDLILLHAPSNYDFRKRAIMYGPISDVIPSTPVFEMYPIGLVSIGAHLERNGMRARIINVANRMLTDPGFDVEKLIRKHPAKAFGIDLHWLPHAHGSLELAALLKKHHPQVPVIMGGLSASYFHEELITYPQVDFVVRGDSTEEPVLQLMKRIARGGPYDDVPNLSWKSQNGEPHHNPMTWVPDSLDGMALDYAYPVRSVLRYRDLAGITPFGSWMDYPITCIITCRGCSYDCATCGGSRYAYKNSFGRESIAVRSPRRLVGDIKSIRRYLKGPIFVVGDIRQPGEDFAEEFLREMKAADVSGPVVLELFRPAGDDFFKKVNAALPDYNLQWSPDSNDEEVRRSFGKGYSNVDIERTVQSALENGCSRLDLFYMIGLPKQTCGSVMSDAVYLRRLLSDFGDLGTILPFISPLAPFVDPGSKVFESPDYYGYSLSCRTLEEHRRLLNGPSWKYMLNYDTQWMSRDEVVAGTYDAALAFNQLKLDKGLISPQAAEGVDARARDAIQMMKAVDRIVADYGPEAAEMMSLKDDFDRLSVSSICQKKELNWPAVPFLRNAPRILWAFATGGELRYGA